MNHSEINKLNQNRTKTNEKFKNQNRKGLRQMKNSQAKNYDDLPLFLNAEMVAKVLGVSISSAYELMHEKDFPSVRIGKRFIVPREDLKAWIENYVERKTKR